VQLTLRKQAPGTVGLDIDGSYLAAAEVKDGVVSRVASCELTEGIAPDGELRRPEDLAREIREFFRSEVLPRNVRLGVANQQIVVRQIDLPHIEDDRERDSAVRFQAAEAVPMPLEDAILDHQVVEQVTVDGVARDRVVVVAARRTMIERLLEAVRGAGLKVEGIDLSAFALVRTLAGSDVAPAQELARVYCHLGRITNLVIARGQTCAFTRPLRTSWDGENGHEGELASSLAEEIRLSIDYHSSLPGARGVADVVLCGPGARAEDLAESLTGVLGRPVLVAEPLGGLTGCALSPEEDPYRYTIAAGLALGAAA
jgi:type IV pilus assembly protein PilM